jgi:uncharacterized protein
MARPRKCRKVCRLPDRNRFGPVNSGEAREPYIIMTVDEYETIRLIDLEDFTQEECANQMNIARTTVQAVYSNARRKLADSLVNGKVLDIEGGDYLLCDGHEAVCGCGGCLRHRYGKVHGGGMGQIV